jgi:hypothetical protein
VKCGNDMTRANATCEVDSVGGRLRGSSHKAVFCEQIVRTTRCNWQNSASELETNTPISIGILVSTVLQVITGKATAITALITTPRSEDFQSMGANFDATDGRRNFACAVVGPIVTPAPSFMERRATQIAPAMWG